MYLADNGDTRWSGTEGTVAADGVSFTDGTINWATKGVNTATDMIYLIDSSLNAYTSKITSAPGTTATLTTAMTAGTYTYFIMRGPKYYDPSNPPTPNTTALPLLAATAGYTPVGNPLCCVYRQRLVLAGYPRHMWYMSRGMDGQTPTASDWDYGADPADPNRAFSGDDVNEGTCGFPITALVPFSDDYLIFGCDNAIFILRGDIGLGGRIDCLSRTVGMIGGKAWAKTPDGALVFLARQGVYVIPPGGGEPIPFSAVIPMSLTMVDTSIYEVTMAYDSQYRGIHIYITLKSPEAVTNQATHWWLGWETKSYWPESYATDFCPKAAIDYHNTTTTNDCFLIGSQTGYLYKYNNSAYRDDSTATTPTPYLSYVVLGPFMAGDGYSEGMLREVVATMSDDSGTTTYEVFAANSPEAVLALPGAAYQGIKVTSTTGVVSGAGATFQDASVADFSAVGVTKDVDSVWLWDSNGTMTKSVISNVVTGTLTLATAQTNGTYSYRIGTTTTAPHFDTWTAGMNYTDHPMIRAGAFIIKITNYANSTWAIDNISCIREQLAKLRKLS